MMRVVNVIYVNWFRKVPKEVSQKLKSARNQIFFPFTSSKQFNFKSSSVLIVTVLDIWLATESVTLKLISVCFRVTV